MAGQKRRAVGVVCTGSVVLQAHVLVWRYSLGLVYDLHFRLRRDGSVGVARGRVVVRQLPVR